MILKTKQSARRKNGTGIGIPATDRITTAMTTESARLHPAGAIQTPEKGQEAPGDTRQKMTKTGGGGREIGGIEGGTGQNPPTAASGETAVTAEAAVTVEAVVTDRIDGRAGARIGARTGGQLKLITGTIDPSQIPDHHLHGAGGTTHRTVTTEDEEITPRIAAADHGTMTTTLTVTETAVGVLFARVEIGTGSMIGNGTEVRLFPETAKGNPAGQG